MGNNQGNPLQPHSWKLGLSALKMITSATADIIRWRPARTSNFSAIRFQRCNGTDTIVSRIETEIAFTPCSCIPIPRIIFDGWTRRLQPAYMGSKLRCLKPTQTTSLCSSHSRYINDHTRINRNFRLARITAWNVRRYSLPTVYPTGNHFENDFVLVLCFGITIHIHH